MSSSGDGPQKPVIPPVDPVTGLVMTKRAIRRRIVKNWERKQKALHEMEEEQYLAEGEPQPPSAQPPATDSAAHGDVETTPPPPPKTKTTDGRSTSRAAATGGVASQKQSTATVRRPKQTTAHHPLRIAASRAASTGYMGGADTGENLFASLGVELPPFEFFFRPPQQASVLFHRGVTGHHTSDGGEDWSSDRHSDDAESLDVLRFGPSPPGGARGMANGAGGMAGTSSAATVDDTFLALVERGGGGAEESSQTNSDNEPSAVFPIASAYGTLTSGAAAFRPTLRHIERQAPMPVYPLAPGTDLNEPTSNYLSMDVLWGTHRHAPGFFRDADVTTETLIRATTRSLSTNNASTVNVISTGDAMTKLFEASYRHDVPFSLQVHRIGPAVLVHAPETPEHRAVDQVHKKALLGKTLYRLREAAEQHMDAASSSSLQTPSSASTLQEDSRALVVPSDPNAPRAGSLTFAEAVQEDSRLHAFGNVLHWGIQNLEVLVGLDTPVLVDQSGASKGFIKPSATDGTSTAVTLSSPSANAGSNNGINDTELTLALLDTSASELTKPGDVQYDALRCWFDATLANIAHVGFCVHNHGVVQSFEMRKVSDLLTMVEGQVAAAAMGYTTSVLHWLLEHCVDEGSTYAVLRNFETNMLELYAVRNAPWDDSRSRASDEDSDRDGDRTRFSELPPGGGDNQAREEQPQASASRAWSSDDVKPNVGGSRQQQQQRPGQQHNKAAAGAASNQATLATLCYKMGLHLASTKKSTAAIQLLIRAFQLLLLHPDHDDAVTTLVDITSRLVLLVQDSLTERLNGVGEEAGEGSESAAESVPPTPHRGSDSAGEEGVERSSATAASKKDAARRRFGGASAAAPAATVISMPEIFQQALFSCIRAEGRLRDHLALRSQQQANTSQTSSSALTINVICSMLVRCGAAVAVVVGRCLDYWSFVIRRIADLKKRVVHRQRDSTLLIHQIALKDLIQVVLEGILVLERIQAAVHSFSSASFPGVAVTGASDDSDETLRSPMGRRVTEEKLCDVFQSASASSTGESCRVVVDPRAERIDTSALASAHCELLGDVFLNVMVDASPMTKKAIEEVCECMMRRDDANRVVHNNVSGGGGGGSGQTDEGLQPPHIAASSSASGLMDFSRLSSSDIVQLSHSAIRYYGKPKIVSQRLIKKIARCYYVVGRHHAMTDRWTKALESLRRCEETLANAEHGPEDVVYSACSQLTSLSWSEVRDAIGAVYLHHAVFRREMSLRAANGNASTALLLLEATPMLEDEERYWSTAVSELTACAQSSSVTCDVATSNLSCCLSMYSLRLIQRGALFNNNKETDDAANAGLFDHIEGMVQRAWSLIASTGPACSDGQLLRTAKLWWCYASSQALCWWINRPPSTTKREESGTSKAKEWLALAMRVLEVAHVELDDNRVATEVSASQRVRVHVQEGDCGATVTAAATNDCGVDGSLSQLALASRQVKAPLQPSLVALQVILLATTLLTSTFVETEESVTLALKQYHYTWTGLLTRLYASLEECVADRSSQRSVVVVAGARVVLTRVLHNLIKTGLLQRGASSTDVFKQLMKEVLVMPPADSRDCAAAAASLMRVSDEVMHAVGATIELV